MRLVPKISTPGRIAYTMIGDTLNNRNIMARYGAILALLSPTFAPIRERLSVDIRSDGSYSQEKDVNDRPWPAVKFQFDPKQNWTKSNDYTDLTTASKVAQPAEATFRIDKVLEVTPIRVDAQDWRNLEAGAQQVRDQLLSTDPVSIERAMATLNQISSAAEVRRALNLTFESSFMAPMENYVLGAINTGAGKNPLYPASAVGAAINLTLFSGEEPTTQLSDDLANLSTKTQLAGRWTVISGTSGKLQTYFRRLGWMGLNNAGIDKGKLTGESNVDVYYSDFIDATIGANHFFVIAPNAAALITFNELAKFAGSDVVNYEYSALPVPSLGIDLDLRIYKGSHLTRSYLNSTSAVDPAPFVNIAPSILYKAWTKPVGFHYPSGHDLYSVNGIFHYVGV